MGVRSLPRALREVRSRAGGSSGPLAGLLGELAGLRRVGRLSLRFISGTVCFAIARVLESFHCTRMPRFVPLYPRCLFSHRAPGQEVPVDYRIVPSIRDVVGQYEL